MSNIVHFQVPNRYESVNRQPSIDALYGVYDTVEEAVTIMDLKALPGRLFGVSTNDIVKLYIYQGVGKPPTEAGASVPEATAGIFGTVKLGHASRLNTTANNPTNIANRTYPIQRNNSGQLLVNVPWEDTKLDVEITSDVAEGGVEVGQVLPAGTTFTEFVQALLSKTYPPVLTAPSYSLSNNGGSSREIGSTISVTLTGTLNRGSIVTNGQNIGYRAGAATNYVFAGISTGTTNTRTISNYVVKANNSFSSTVTHAIGDQPKDSKGNNVGLPLPEGDLPATTSFIGYYRRYAGPVSSIPTSGSQIRTNLLSTSVLNTGNSFSFSSGSTEKTFVIAVPPGKTLSKVVNQNTNQDLTSGFVLSTTLTTIPDAGGNLVSGYKVYIMTNDVSFTSNQTINVTLV